MADFISEFMKSLGPEVSKQMAGSLGIKQNDVMKMIPQVAPLILGVLKLGRADGCSPVRYCHLVYRYGL
ncbi:MAG: hypothetical protein KDI38_23575, partial [Calditrichaeota bacterium]|nr:hypothetical protein [Calditrichota bacterium]